MNRSKQVDRNIGVDILRGIAILSVLLLHLNLQVEFKQTYLGELLSRRWYSLFFWSGFYGVVIFFVISGYLITNSALKKWGSLTTVNTREFYIYRFARIMPLLVLLMLVLSGLHLFNAPNFVLNPDKVSLGRAVFAAMTFHFNWLEIQVGYLPGNWDILWSLSIEETFYLAFPLLCLLVRKEWQFVALVIVFFAISPWARVGMYPDNELGDRNHLAYIDAIALGCITALVANRITISRKVLTGLLPIGWMLIIFIFFFRREAYQWGLTMSGLYITVLILGVSLVLLWMHHRHLDGKQRKRFPLHWFASLGQYSYEIYLTHMFIVYLLVGIFEKLDLQGAWVYIFYLVVIILSYLLGSLVANYFTNPLNDWMRKRWIIKKVKKELD